MILGFGPNAKYIITARWFDAEVNGCRTDIIQINNEFYAAADPGILSAELEDSWHEGGQIIVDTLNDIIDAGDPYGVLRFIRDKNPDWITAEICSELKCECGADATYGPTNSCHSDWCAKYQR